MDVSVKFPILDDECSMFISIGVPSNELPKAEKNKIESFISKLKKLREIYYRKLYERDTPTFESYQYKKYKTKIIFFQNEIKQYSIISYQFKQRIFAKFWGITDQMITVLEICLKNNVLCTCDLARFQQYTNDKYHEEMPIKNYKWKIRAMYHHLNLVMKADENIKIPTWSNLLPKLAAKIDKESKNVNVDLGYAPPSEVDNMIYSIFETKSMWPREKGRTFGLAESGMQFS